MFMNYMKEHPVELYSSTALIRSSIGLPCHYVKYCTDDDKKWFYCGTIKLLFAHQTNMLGYLLHRLSLGWSRVPPAKIA